MVWAPGGSKTSQRVTFRRYLGAPWEQFGRYFDYILEALWGYVLIDFWKVPRMILGLLDSFFYCFESVLPSPETWSRPRRKARAKTTGFDRILFRRISGVCTHLSLVLLYSFWLLQLLQHLRTCFCNAHPLNALPVPLLRQV